MCFCMEEHSSPLSFAIRKNGGGWRARRLRATDRISGCSFSLVLATIPGAVAGYFLADIIEGSLRTTGSVGYEFIVNGIILILAERFAQTRSREDTRVVDALLIGCAQALALSPGLSRSALTIAAGRALNFRRRDALDFSFLMATPIIAGATIFAATDIAQGGVLLPSLPVIVAGITSALCASVVAILFLRAFVAKKVLRSSHGISFLWVSCFASHLETRCCACDATRMKRTASLPVGRQAFHFSHALPCLPSSSSMPSSVCASSAA